MTQRVSDCGTYHDGDLAVQFHGFPPHPPKARPFDRVLGLVLLSVIVASSIALVGGLGRLFA